MKELAGTPTLSWEGSADINIFWIIIKITLSLIFIGFLIFLVLWVLKRKSKIFEEGLIQVIATKNIGFGKYIQIVEIIDRILIVGIGTNINILSEIKDKDEIDFIKTELSKEKGKKSPNLLFQSFLKKRIDFIENEKDRLGKI